MLTIVSNSIQTSIRMDISSDIHAIYQFIAFLVPSDSTILKKVKKRQKMYFDSRWLRASSDKGFFHLAAPFADNIVTKIGRCPSGRGPRDDAARLNRREKSLRISGYVVRKKEGRGGMMRPVQETTPASYLLFDVIYEGKRKCLVRKQCLSFLKKGHVRGQNLKPLSDFLDKRQGVF